MTDLASKRCIPCEGGVRPANAGEIRTLHLQVPDWQVVERDGGERLERAYPCEDFAQAIELADRIGHAAEEQGHHPVLVVEWGKLTVTWWTHAIGGLHENDFVMAARSDVLFREMTD